MINLSGIWYLYEIITSEDQPRALAVINALIADKALNRGQIIAATDSTYYKGSKVIDALEAKGFICGEGRGRAKVYSLTKAGVGFVKMIGKLKDCGGMIQKDNRYVLTRDGSRKICMWEGGNL